MQLNWNHKVTPEQDFLTDNCTAKYNMIPKGRRFGLTNWYAIYAVESLIHNMGPILWGDTINANIDRYFQRYFQPELNKIGKEFYIWNQQKRELRTANTLTLDPSSEKASICDFRSSDIPENWEGFGYRLIIINEAGIILKNEYLYKNAILPMLLDYPDSRLIAGGVPKGKTTKNGAEHPFYSLCKKATEGNKNYKIFTFSSYSSAVASKEDIDALVEDMGGHNHPIVRQEIYGEFIDVVDQPFLYEFHESIHVSETELIFNPRLPVYVCWDFNVKSTCLIIQFYGIEINVLAEYHERGIENICAMVEKQYPGMYFINGDASGKNDNASNETFYDQVKTCMNLSWDSFHISKSNPRHKASYKSANKAFKHLTLRINKSCKQLIRDCNLVQILQKNGKLEIDKSDQTLTHHLDPLRYHIHTEHLDTLKRAGIDMSDDENS